MGNNCFLPVVLHYIGPGKRNTGDWCFEDGFITFTDLTDLYLQLLHGRVLTIVTDCSHSGCWVKQCMTFLDEQGVGPCGHSARDKGILIKVFASCLSHQVPRQLAFSVHGCLNSKNTEVLLFYLPKQIAPTQHVYNMDATRVKCGQDSIQGKCLQLPQENWQTWNRIRTVRGTDRGKKAWHIILTNDDETAVYLRNKIQSGDVDVADFGQVLKSGWGEGPTDEERASIIKFNVPGHLVCL